MSKAEAKISAADLNEHLRYDPAEGRFWRRSNGAEWARIRGPFQPRSGSLSGHNLYAPRVAFAMMFGRWPTGAVGFVNRDPSDCRFENLVYRASKLARRYTRHETAWCVIYDWGVHAWRYRLFECDAGEDFAEGFEEHLSPPYSPSKAGFRRCAEHAGHLIDYLAQQGKEVRA